MLLQLFEAHYRTSYSVLTNVVILLLCFSNVSVSAEIFHIVPTANTPCPQEGVPCMTLSQFANTIHENLTANASLVLLPGNHTLDSNFTITDVISFSIHANFADDFKVFCSNEVYFSFQDIEDIQLYGVTFYGCIAEIEFVDQLLFEQCQFENDSRLILTTVNFISIRSSSFSGNNADYGGSLYVSNSSIHLSNSKFSNNVALYLGGALYATQGSTIVITSCSFTNNSIEEGEYDGIEYKGGGAVSISASAISIIDSEFANNSALTLNNATVGGAMFVDLNSSLNISNSLFRDNIALFGGGALAANCSNVLITQTKINNNQATFNLPKSPKNPGGGGGIFFNSAIHLDNCVFIGNVAQGNGDGGAVQVDGGIATFNKTMFMNNVARTGGSVSVESDTKATLSNCVFHNNTIIEDQLGSAIACRDCISMITENCTFTNNFAAAMLSVGTVSFACRVFNGCGGSIENSTFINNTVSGIGGAAIVIIGGSVIIKNNTHFQNNMGGVILMLNSYLLLNGTITITNNFQSPFSLMNSTVVFSGNVTIDSNLGYPQSSSQNIFNDGFEVFFGGTLSLYGSRAFFNGTTVFAKNKATTGGAIFALESMVQVAGELNITDNSASISGGGIFAYQSEIYNMGATNFVKNIAEQDGGGIHAFSSRINLMKGFVYIAGNRAQRGGGFYLESSLLHVVKTQPECTAEISKDVTPPGLGNFTICQTNETKWLRFDFVNNSAELGGAIFVSDNTASATCDVQYAECFFQVQASYDYTPLIESREIFRILMQRLFNFRNVYFSNNSATLAGNTLHGGLLDRCGLSYFAEALLGIPVIPISRNLDATAYFIDTTNVQLDDVSSEPVRVCFCNNSVPNCDFRSHTRMVRKGESFNISLVAVDHVNHTMRSSIQSIALRNASLTSGQVVQTTEVNCTELNYNVKAPINAYNASVELYALGPCGNRGISRSTLEIQFLPCPIGFVETEVGCVCDPLLQNRSYVLDCFIDSQMLLRPDDIWISYNYSSVNPGNNYLVSVNCPFDYCRPGNINFSLNTPHGADAQCAFERSGLLCGHCNNGSNGLSHLLGSSGCRKCSNNWLALLILFAIAGILLVTLILMCNLTVAVGTIEGVIFYANIVGANRALFLSSHQNPVTVIIAWINIDIGFETCFYDGMDAYAKTWLKIVFPAYIITLVILIIIISECSQQFAKLISKKNPVATLATLILLSFTKFLGLIIAGFSRHRVTLLSNNTDSESDLYSESHLYVWGIDGDIGYFVGKHIPLLVAVIIISVLILLFTFLLLFWQCLLRFSNRPLLKWLSSPKLSTFIDAYHAPYKKNHRYWPGLLLLLRLFLYFISTVVDDQLNIMIITLTATFILTLNILIGGGMFKKWTLNVLLMSFIVNLLVFSSCTAFVMATDRPQSQSVIIYTSTSVAILTFFLILLYHLYTFILSGLPLFNKFTHVSVKKFQSLCCTKSKPSEMTESEKAIQKTEPSIPRENYSVYRDHLESIIHVSISDVVDKRSQEEESTHDNISTDLNVEENEQKGSKLNFRAVTRTFVDGVPYCERVESF